MVEKQSFIPLRIGVILFVVVAALLGAHQISQAQSPDQAEGTAYGNCRYGVALMNSGHVSWLDDLGVGWYLNFGRTAPVAPNNAEFVPVIAVQQDRDGQGGYLPTYSTVPPLTEGGLGALVDSRPGGLWMVGNEVDRVGIQGDTYPDVYATAYHDVYHFIKQRDPDAQVSNSALVQITPGRLQYMDLMWDAYLEQYGSPMPVDVWNMHLYILPEKDANGQGTGAHIALGTDPDLAILSSGNDSALCPREDVYCYAEHDDMNIFEKQVRDMRSWMLEKGQRNKPLIISEFSQLYVFTDYDDPVNPTHCYVQDEYGNCFTQQRVSEFLNNSFTYLETATDPNLGYPQDGNRLVQQWLWYATAVGQNETGGSSNLLNQSGTALTQVGQAYVNFVQNQSLHVNLKPKSVSAPPAFTNGATVTATLSAEVLNSGNRSVGAPFDVTFYSDAGLSQVIGSATVPAATDVLGCARETQRVSVEWSNLSEGRHSFWVKVDGNNAIGESNENDNVMKGTLLVDPDQVFVPIIRQRH
ncbi:MAG TPA: CARDB domain-containing protein [Candidatus Sulfomarinibacteraceae bacterium]|nr:CARDB domain-containing protein [Candidatus Sulfomarinibacteraceae bacterium]